MEQNSDIFAAVNVFQRIKDLSLQDTVETLPDGCSALPLYRFS